MCCCLVIAICVAVYLIWDWRSRLPRVSDITKKCVFITGCDSGFGQALAIRLDSIGVPVFAGCLTEEGSAKLKEQASDRLRTVTLNVTDVDSIREAYDYVKANLLEGTVLWGVVNNAGVIGTGGPLEFINYKEIHDVMKVNFLGMTEVTSRFLPLLKQSKGRIVNISSISGFLPIFSNYAYLASKHAVLGFTNALRLEKKEWGLKVSCVEPGIFRTLLCDQDLYKMRKMQQWNALDEELRKEFGEKHLRETLSVSAKMVDRAANPDLSLVVDAYEHALFSTRPKAHYFPGRDAKVLRFLSFFPGFVVDYALIKLLKGPTPKVLKPKHLQVD